MTKNKTTKKLNKSAWIRKQAKSLSAKEVMTKAKAEGITLSVAQVYTARNQAKNVTGAKLGRPRKDAVMSSLSDLQRQFVGLAVRIGTDEAKRLLELAGQPVAAPKAAPKAAKPTVANGLSLNSIAQA
jgi:hypothetical protein